LSSLRVAVCLRDRKSGLLFSGGSGIKWVFVGKRPVSSSMAVVTIGVSYGRKPRVFEIPSLQLIASIVRCRHCILALSSTGGRIGGFSCYRKPWWFRRSFHETSVAVVSMLLQPAGFLSITLAVRSRSSSVEHHPRRSQSVSCLAGSRRLATPSSSRNSSLDDDPLLLDSLWRLRPALDGTESPLPKARRHIPVDGRSIDGVSAIILQAVSDAAVVADGELADAALLQGAAALLVAEVALGRGHVGRIPSVVSGVEAREERPRKLGEEGIGWLRRRASGGLVLFVRGAGRALLVGGADGSAAGRVRV
jgi:hypothetical protein